MNDPPQPRRSRWRFSLREMLLLTLTIAAFLGWGQALYRRYQPFAPTPFAGYFAGGGLGKDIVAALQERGATVPDYAPGVGSGSSGPSSMHREMIEDLELSSAYTAAFVDALFQQVRKRIVENGCREYRIAHRNSSEPDEGFSLHYRRDATAGSILVYVVRIDEEQVRLVAILDEHRAP